MSDNGKIRIILVLGLILLWSPFVQHYFHTQAIYSNPFFRVLEFTIGVLVSQMNRCVDTDNKLILLLRKPTMCIFTIICLIAGVSFAYYIGIPHDFMLYNWVALPCFISLLVSLGYINSRPTKFVQYMINISFSILLSQLLVVWYGVKYILSYIGCDSNIAKILFPAIVCFGIANCLHYCIEKPATKYLKTKFVNK